MNEETREFQLAPMQGLIGKTIASVDYALVCDEGFRVTFTDGTALSFGFSGCEGIIELFGKGA
jgi:hypothetical protein